MQTKRFLHIAAGFPGSMYDSRIFRCTNIYDLLENGEILSEPLPLSVKKKSVESLVG